MSAWYALLALVAALLALLALVLRVCFPYLVSDVLYVVKGVRVALRLRRFRGSTPCYSILDRFLDSVGSHPQKVFVLFEGRSFTYREADRLSSKAARALLQHTELREGDTVALLLGNQPDLIWTWIGLFKLGCSVALLNTNIRARSLLHCFTCCGAKTLITGADLKDAVEEILPALREQEVGVFLLGESCEQDGLVNLSEKMNAASDEELPRSLRSRVTMKSPAFYIYTSGTTGLPKAAVISHERVWLASFLQSMSGVHSDDIIYVYLPLYHSAGLLMGLTGAIERGVTVVLKRKFSVSQFWIDCRKHNVTVIQYIGEIMRYLCNTPKADSDRMHNVRLALGNGIRPDTWVEFLQRFGDIRVCECYGATEGNIGFVNYTGKVGAIGRMNVILKKLSRFALIKYDPELGEPVRDSRGFCVEVSAGETGLLVAKITKVAPFSGYANNKQQTDKKKLRDVFEQGDIYFNSGDLMKVDKEGFVFFQDRIGDTFRWKGENVATTEVADILIMVDFIEEANVYGVKVPGHEGRIGMAAIKLMEGRAFDISAAYKHIESYLPMYARPRFIRIQEVLDTTGTYKQMKVKLTEEGFDPKTIKDKMYFLDDRKKAYVPMTEDIFNSISNGHLRL
ncbi:long-chain fatty acid transport protein 2-like [Clarias gariepinus]|uniref:long-chain fatty acid transport protein 2-like n=1 Tax=Clarias gariepinus TaxID=13013 RepID=UPI00234D57D6|nr:long-chain fatty acid transport protein 2-like [Clarias gariepinus]